MSYILDRDVDIDYEVELSEIVSAFCGAVDYDQEQDYQNNNSMFHGLPRGRFQTQGKMVYSQLYGR